jgi:hypothetical protein
MPMLTKMEQTAPTVKQIAEKTNAASVLENFSEMTP